MKGVRYIYRLEPQRSGNAERQALLFARLRYPSDGFRRLGLLRDAYGWTGTLKALLKLGIGRRALFGFVRDDRLACSVWATEHSPRYPIEAYACVLGPLQTRPEMRRQGLATALLQAAIRSLAEQGYRAVYIDTTPSNVASRTAIVRAGFAPYAVLSNGRLTKVKDGGIFPQQEFVE
jgi:GNAT superfamily N-acetyltransferase